MMIWKWKKSIMGRQKLRMVMTPGSLVLLISASILLAAGEPRASETMEIPRSSFGLGSARYLEGRNLFYSLFVDTPESRWSREEKEVTLKNLKAAAAYIEEAAQEYQVEAEFGYNWQENETLTGDAEVDFAIADDQNFIARLDWEIASWMEKKVDFRGLMQEYDAQGIALLVFVNNPGTSYSAVYDGLDNPKESIVFFSEEPPAVYAHEILHLFGAHDLYRDAEYSERTTDYIARAYPMEIMRTVLDEKGKKHENEIVNNISPLTAYHLGWIEDVEEIREFPQLKR